MKTQNFIPKTLLLLILGFGLLTLNSCSEDDDENSSEEQTISFRVNLTKIKATDTSGEGSSTNVELEIFGELSTSLTLGTTVDSRLLWSADEENFISVGQNDTQLSGEATFTIAADKIGNSTITCAGDLLEYDGNGFVQEQGEASSTFALAAITGTQDIELTFSETAGQTSVVTFIVTRL